MCEACLQLVLLTCPKYQIVVIFHGSTLEPAITGNVSSVSVSICLPIIRNSSLLLAPHPISLSSSQINHVWSICHAQLPPSLPSFTDPADLCFILNCRADSWGMWSQCGTGCLVAVSHQLWCPGQLCAVLCSKTTPQLWVRHRKAGESSSAAPFLEKDLLWCSITSPCHVVYSL